MDNHRTPEKASFLRGRHAVASVADGNTLARLPALDLPALCDVLEFRVDIWPERAADGLACAMACTVPPLIAVRRPEEGGQNRLSCAERAALIRRFLPAAALLDIEIAALGELAGPLTEAKAGGVIIVASHHDFAGTPARDELRRKIDAAQRAGADIVKFATTLRTSADVALLASLLEEENHPPLSVMGMGPLGKASRLLLAQLGSVLNYGYLDRATVQGQWSAARLRTLLAELNEAGPPPTN